MKKTRVLAPIILFVTLILSTGVVYAAEHLNTSDFGEPNVQGVGKSYYKPGERLEFLYYVVPAEDDLKVKLDNRYYYVHSSLDSVTLRATVFLATGASIQHQYLNGRCQNPEDTCEVLDGTVKMSFKIGDTGSSGGVDEIEVEVKGTVPSVEKRLETVKALYIEVSDADEDVLPAVEIKVLNLDQFTKDIEDIKIRYNNLHDRSNELEDEGAVTVKADDYLEKANQNITLADNYYKEGDYVKADEKLNNAEKMLDSAEVELKKAEAEFVYEQAGDELDKLSVLLVEFELTIREARDAGLAVSSYEFQLINLKSKYTNLVEKNDKTQDYLENNKFDDAIKRSKDVTEEVQKLTVEANTYIAELREKIDEVKSPTPTPTPTQTASTPQPSFFDEQRDKLVIVGAIIAILIGGGGAAVYLYSKYKHQKTFDELK
jgi:tetratricopeptide (TPR) repeat protein